MRQTGFTPSSKNGMMAEPIKFTPDGERVFEVKQDRDGYTVVIERFSRDQYGHRWHSFHTEWHKGIAPSNVTAAPTEVEPDDDPPELDVEIDE